MIIRFENMQNDFLYYVARCNWLKQKVMKLNKLKQTNISQMYILAHTWPLCI